MTELKCQVCKSTDELIILKHCDNNVITDTEILCLKHFMLKALTSHALAKHYIPEETKKMEEEVEREVQHTLNDKNFLKSVDWLKNEYDKFDFYSRE